MSATPLAFPTPASLGSLDQYIQAVNRFPLSRSSVRISIGFPAVLSGLRSRQRGAWLFRQVAVLLIPAGRHDR